MFLIRVMSCQETFTYSKSAIETLEKGIKLFDVYNKKTRTTSFC